MSIKPKERERQMKIENTCFPNESNVGIERFSITYFQENDNCDINNDGQFLTIEAQPGDTGFFLVIKTKRWAIDEPKEIAEILEDFKKRLLYSADKIQKK